MSSSTQQARVQPDQRSAGEEARSGRWDSLTDWARAQAGILMNPIARFLGRVGIHANTVTIFGLLLQVMVGVILGLGYIRLGGWLLLFVGPFDALDGAVARILGQRSRFGAFLDSTLDRLSDAALILGLTWHYLRQGTLLEVGLLLVSLVASMMVSYIRARAETLGFTCKVGLLTRMERVLLIGVLSALGLPGVLVYALSGLSLFTMVQRFAYVHACARQMEGGT